MRTLKGIRALIRLFRSSNKARSALQALKPAAVFSTGGYSAAPVMRAARSLGVPYVIHEQNSIPGRSNRMFAQQAKAVATTFKKSDKQFPGARVVRTGLPVRKELRLIAAEPPEDPLEHPLVFIFGGSQGAKFLNEHMPAVAKLMHDDRFDWLHVSGPSHHSAVCSEVQTLQLPHYHVQPYLQGSSMGQAYQHASLVVCRSGGSLAELAVFGIPSVLVPLPTAAGNHQYHNAKEFADMGAAVLHPEDRFDPTLMAAAVREWASSRDRRQKAKEALRNWDIPDSTERIVALIEEAASKK